MPPAPAPGQQTAPLALTGHVVTFDPARPELPQGAVYIDGEGVIAAVQDAKDAPPKGFEGQSRVDTGSVLYPGLIDLHNHFAYNTIPLWEAAGAPYRDHHSWTRETKPLGYATAVSWPARVFQQAAPEALIKYVEVRALVGGTTSIQGAPHTTRPVDGWLLRIIDNEPSSGPGTPDRVLCSALQQEVEQLRGEAAKLAQGYVLIYHTAEGKPGSAVYSEFTDLETAGCVRPGLIGVHATALATADFGRWETGVRNVDASQKGTIAWSPFSNLWLYHQTTDVVQAHAQGLRIALGSDWAPSGTKHVLGELKVADVLNQQSFEAKFSDLELCQMVTANAGDALNVALGRQLGRLQPGAPADLIVVHQGAADPYRNLIEATEQDVELVVVRGEPFYGTPALMRAVGAPVGDPITVSGTERTVVVRSPGAKDATLDWPQVCAALEEVRRDPQAAWHRSQRKLAAYAGPAGAAEAPLVITGDMPMGDSGLLATTGDIPPDLTLPPLDSLTHDDAFFAAIKRSGAPYLDGLAAYWG